MHWYMTTQEAVDALRPLTSSVPSDAIDFIRDHWPDAEACLLAVIDERLTAPAADDDDGLFTYAIHLCAEMRSEDAFPLFIRIARLPNLLLDNVMGDILTETFPQMLARTCHGRIDELKGVVEDSTRYEYSRAAALDALFALAVDGDLDQAAFGDYCVELLQSKLERKSSVVWSTTIETCSHLKVAEALPLIRDAFRIGVVHSRMVSLEWVNEQYERIRDGAPLGLREGIRPFRTTEAEVRFFVKSWGRNDAGGDEQLLEVLARRTDGADGPRAAAKISRNAPCPCGSGKKYKKCCLLKAKAEPAEMSVLGNSIRDEHAAASNWMEAGYYYAEDDHDSLEVECWQRCWQELVKILPASLRDPQEAEATGAFEGYNTLVPWLLKFEGVITAQAEHSAGSAAYALEFLTTALAMFPAVNPEIREQLQRDQARITALLGDSDKAVAMLKELITQYPSNAGPYVELSDFYGFEAERLFNRCTDLKEAIAYLEQAEMHARDCDDYDVARRLTDLRAIAAARDVS
jgi:tetratricopeptide (TPR) repeat protein